jgi:ABC-type multidrug transport system ATPase subunit
LARFLFDRGTAQAAKDALRRRGYLQRGVEGPIMLCLQLLNGVVNDPQPWPAEMLAQVPIEPETANAGLVAGSGMWERRRYRRMLLNDLFEGALAPRLGYSPRLGTLRWYVENRLVGSRLRDELDKYIRQRMRGGVAVEVRRNEYPLLNDDQIVAFPGFVRALADPVSLAGRQWMEAIARVDTGVAEKCRMIRDGVGGIVLAESELVRCLNAAIADGQVIPAAAATAAAGASAELRTFIAMAPRVYRLVDRGLALFNRRTLEIAFRGWIPEPPPVRWDEDTDGEEDELDGEVPHLLQDAYLRAVLDLVLVTRIPPDRMGRATRTGLSWYGAVDGKATPGVMDELVRWFQVEHHEAVVAWETLGDEGGKDERDRETQAKAVADGEKLLERVGDSTLREVIGRLQTGYLVDGKELTPAQLLERLGFRRDQLSARVGDLSGGQRRRLQLMLTILDEPNVLVLDEPTNDVDIDMLSATEDLLDSWPGTLIVVSHDRYLLERVTDQQYAILDGHLRHLPGGVDEYLRIKAQRPTGGPSQPRTQQSAPAQALSGAALRNVQKEISALDRAITKLTERINAKHVELAEYDQSDHAGIGRLSGELRTMESELSDTENRWLELSERIESDD